MGDLQEEMAGLLVRHPEAGKTCKRTMSTLVLVLDNYSHLRV